MMLVESAMEIITHVGTASKYQTDLRDTMHVVYVEETITHVGTACKFQMETICMTSVEYVVDRLWIHARHSMMRVEIAMEQMQIVKVLAAVVYFTMTVVYVEEVLQEDVIIHQW